KGPGRCRGAWNLRDCGGKAKSSSARVCRGLAERKHRPESSDADRVAALAFRPRERFPRLLPAPSPLPPQGSSYPAPNSVSTASSPAQTVPSPDFLVPEFLAPRPFLLVSRPLSKARVLSGSAPLAGIRLPRRGMPGNAGLERRLHQERA